MTLVQRCAVAKTANQDSKLEGLIDKLIALRSEIDATLAELASHGTTVSAAAPDQPDTAAETAEGPRAGPEQPLAPDLPGERERLPESVIEALAEAAPALLAPASDAQSHSREAADMRDTGDKAEMVDAPAAEIVLAASQPIEAVPACADVIASDPPPVLEKAPQNEESPLVAVSTPAAQQDDLTRISAIDADLAERLAAEGIVGYAQIAGWSEGDVMRVSQALDLGRRISKENWIEQASLLAAGKTTAFAESRDAVLATDAASAGQPADDRQTESSTAAAPAAEGATILVFDKSRRRSPDVVAPPCGAAAAPVRRRRRVGTLVLATAAVMIAAAVLIGAEGVAWSEQARSAVSHSVRNLLDKVSWPFDPAWQGPAVREDLHGVQAPHAGTSLDLLGRHRQIWPSGS